MNITLGSKLSHHHGLGQKAQSVGKKVLKKAITAGKVLGGGIAVLGAIGAATGFEQPGAKMVRQRGGLESMIRGGNR
jgi:hypothetical protein